MLAKAVHHVSFRVDALEPALRFYRDVLGLRPVERPDFGFPGAWLETPEGTQIHLIVAPANAGTGSPPEKTNPIANHTAFAVDDYAAARDRLRAAGLEVLETNAEMGQMWVRDPSGNVIEFTAAR